MRSAARLGWSLVVAAGAVSLGIGALPSQAGAAAPDTQGWWWTGTDVGGAPLPPPAPPPDVPSDGLYIQADAGGSTPVAYAALSYRLPDGASISGPLQLTVAPGSATTPGATLEACPLKAPDFQSAQGGPGSAAPAYDCTHHTMAAVSSSGTGFSLDVSGLASGQTLAVALLPASGLERVVLSRPDGNSLTVSGGTGAASSPSAQQAPDSSATDALPAPGDAGGVPAASAAVPAAPDTGPAGTPGPAAPTLASEPPGPGGAAGPTPPAGVQPSGANGSGSVAAAPATGNGAPTGLSAARAIGSSGAGTGGEPWAWALMVAGVTTAAGLWAAARHDWSGRASEPAQPVIW